MNNRALLVVDLQRDFCSGGALAVPDADRVVPVINRLIERFSARGLPILCTRDWHPPDHCSFQTRGGPWPVHCVAGSPGAEHPTDLRLPAGVVVIDKATRREAEAYSGFSGTDLAERLRGLQVTEIVVCGLATDYCVKHTVLDARREGFPVTLVEDAVRGVDLRPGDAARAVESMRKAGVSLVEAEDVRP